MVWFNPEPILESLAGRVGWIGLGEGWMFLKFRMSLLGLRGEGVLLQGNEVDLKKSLPRTLSSLVLLIDYSYPGQLSPAPILASLRFFCCD